MNNQATVRQQMTAQEKLAEAARLRDQLRSEIIESKKLCNYEPHECRHVRVENHNYCHLHILEDENAPFKQCAYIYNSTGKKCYMPASKNDNKQGYCNEHIKRAAVLKNKTTQKIEPAESSETILHSLIHYVKPTSSRHRTQSGNSDISNNHRVRTVSGSSAEKDDENANDDSKQVITRSYDPFNEIDAAKVNASCNETLEYASESESDVEPTVYNNVWHSQNADLSDNESIDSECEDPLKHAEIYTAEEVCSLTRDKLIRLQDLYIDQFRFLQRVLREKRRKYLHALKKEKESLASIHNQVRDNPKEYKLYQKLKYLNSYQKRSGVEAILQKRVNDMRAKLSVDGTSYKAPPFVKCLFTEGGVKCGSRALPHAKHCLKHILNDPTQVLFRACGVSRGDADMTCHEPVPDVFPDQACVYHTDIPALRSYTHMKQEQQTSSSSADYTTATTDNNAEVYEMLKVDDLSSNIEIQENVADDLHLQVEDTAEMIVDNELEVATVE
ncbi:KAT8 regulatory NSL complex subunit 2 isoform X2 [Chrysoperla carnea]|uniref:KAT8 regulatory NSL complex subunit 2 isoform X2 n=1 Tax=Chrysoperla carnea TaxID=189513 RepID=UPI001D085C11|nr:KAT8 regulatory NSL complex subunit 2 isoform X2 [Chrysoperla carnea]